MFYVHRVKVSQKNDRTSSIKTNLGTGTFTKGRALQFWLTK